MRFLRLFKGERQRPDLQEKTEEILVKGVELKRTRIVEIKTSEFSLFLNLAIKYGKREIMAVGTGSYIEGKEKIVVGSVYPVVIGWHTSVTLTRKVHEMFDEILDEWNEKDEVMILHTHPGFSSRKSHVDDHALQIAALVFGGKAVMLIIDPFSSFGIETTAYAINPETKQVERIGFRLVP